MINSSLDLALLILAIEFGLLCIVILFKTRKSERAQQDTAVAGVTSLIGAVERTEDTRKEALRTTLQEIYKVDAAEAEGMVEEFVEREHAFYNAVIGIHLGRSGKALSDLPAEVTRLIAPWLRLTPRGQVDESAVSALADQNSALTTELDETRQVLERLMAEYSAAFDRERAGAAPAPAGDEGLLSMDEAVAPAPQAATPQPVKAPTSNTVAAVSAGAAELAQAMPDARTPVQAASESLLGTGSPDKVPATADTAPAAEPEMSPDTIINLDEAEEPQMAMSQDDLDALLENLGDDIFGTGGSAQAPDKPSKA